MIKMTCNLVTFWRNVCFVLFFWNKQKNCLFVYKTIRYDYFYDLNFSFQMVMMRTLYWWMNIPFNLIRFVNKQNDSNELSYYYYDDDDECIQEAVNVNGWNEKKKNLNGNYMPSTQQTRTNVPIWLLLLLFIIS